MKKVTEIPATIFPKAKNTKAKLNVAAYCRVSTESETQENSLENQTMHYKNEIESNPNWTLVDVFVDFGVLGRETVKRKLFGNVWSDLKKEYEIARILLQLMKIN